MPSAKRPPSQTRAARPPARAAAVKIITPEAEEVSFDFELAGETYRAHMPKDFVWMELFASTSPSATISQKVEANRLFMDACLAPSDRDRIRARMLARPSTDPARGLELMARIRDLIKMWEPYLDEEFRTALNRAEA